MNVFVTMPNAGEPRSRRRMPQQHADSPHLPTDAVATRIAAEE
jgi:hypothetical protein